MEGSPLRKVFSKDHAQDLRDETAQEIKRIRSLPIASKDAPEEIRNSYITSEMYQGLQTNIVWRTLDRSDELSGIDQYKREVAITLKTHILELLQERNS